MAKNKLTKEDIKQLKYIIGKYIYKKEGLDKIREERIQLEETFKKYIETTYYSLYDFSAEMIDFCKKYNAFDNVSIDVCRNYSVKEPLYGNFNPNSHSMECDFYTDNYSLWNNNFMQLPYYHKLSYIPMEGFYEDHGYFYNFINKKYKDTLYDNFKLRTEKSKKALEIYENFKDILMLCHTDLDVNEHFQIPEITEYFEKRFGKKLSTDLSTVNKEKIDFIKNYLNSVDNKN